MKADLLEVIRLIKPVDCPGTGPAKIAAMAAASLERITNEDVGDLPATEVAKIQQAAERLLATFGEE